MMTTAAERSKTLSNTLGFTADDLAANRTGHLSVSQIAALRADARPFWRMLAIVGVFAVLFGGVLLMVDSPQAPLLLLLALMVPGGFALLFAIRLAGIYASIADGSVVAVEGPAHPYAKRNLNRGGVAYYVRIGAEEFFIPYRLQQAFVPGETYHIFYTPKGRLIVSGESAPPPTAEVSRLPTPQLAQVLGFDWEDLAANRAGRLSPAQATRLRRLRTREIYTAIVSGLAAVGVGLLWPLLDHSTTMLLFWGLILIFPVAFLLTALWSIERRSRDLRAGVVAEARGILHRRAQDVGSTRRQPTYTLGIGHVVLPVALDVYNAFTDGDSYVVYFVAHSRLLLSAEPLDT